MARTASVQWAGPELSPVWLNQVRELSEFWIHRQQLLDALDREPDLRSDVLGPVFNGLRWAYPYRLANQKRPLGDTVTIDISGPVAATWHLVASEQGWNFAKVAGNQVATIAMTTDEAWRLLTNNLPRGRRPRSRRQEIRTCSKCSETLAPSLVHPSRGVPVRCRDGWPRPPGPPRRLREPWRGKTGTSKKALPSRPWYSSTGLRTPMSILAPSRS